jgi:hypothetical protein
MWMILECGWLYLKSGRIDVKMPDVDAIGDAAVDVADVDALHSNVADVDVVHSNVADVDAMHSNVADVDAMHSTLIGGV